MGNTTGLTVLTQSLSKQLWDKNWRFALLFSRTLLPFSFSAWLTKYLQTRVWSSSSSKRLLCAWTQTFSHSSKIKLRHRLKCLLKEKKKKNPWHWDTDEYDKVEVIGIQWRKSWNATFWTTGLLAKAFWFSRSHKWKTK